MAKTAKIKVKDKLISIVKRDEQDYICLTDMLKAKDRGFFISDWLRNRNTLEFLSVWEKFITQILIMANSPQLEINPD